MAFSIQWRFGVSNQFYLQTALMRCAISGTEQLGTFDFQDLMEKIALRKGMPGFISPFGKRWFSGGKEKKQRYFANGGAGTELCILDESDSGLDIDALKWSPMA